MADRTRSPKPKNEEALPEGFAWDKPRWFRIDRFHASPATFLLRVIGGGLIGLLLGRVVGSLEGIFLQWVYGGLSTAVGPVLEETLGALLYWVALVVGKVFSPFFFASPLENTLQALESQKTGSVALLLLAQLHGTLNGLHQGLRPALGDRLLPIIERLILPWGRLWRWLTYPFARLIFRPVRRDELKALLVDATNESAQKRLVSLARHGQIPDTGSERPFWTERETVSNYPGKQPPDTREQLWWKNPAFRREVYDWIEQKRIVEALPLLERSLHDPDSGAREAAVSALASLKRVEAMPHLIQLLEDEKPVSTTAAEGLRSLAPSL